MNDPLSDFVFLQAHQGQVYMSCVAYPTCSDQRTITVRPGVRDGSHTSLATIVKAANQHLAEHHAAQESWRPA